MKHIFAHFLSCQRKEQVQKLVNVELRVYEGEGLTVPLPSAMVQNQIQPPFRDPEKSCRSSHPIPRPSFLLLSPPPPLSLSLSIPLSLSFSFLFSTQQTHSNYSSFSLTSPFNLSLILPLSPQPLSLILFSPVPTITLSQAHFVFLFLHPPSHHSFSHTLLSASDYNSFTPPPHLKRCHGRVNKRSPGCW